jgi:methylated-DNA-[protein]-cysteine S-methyltransferase
MKSFNLAATDSPLGGLLLATDEAGRVCALEFADHRFRMHRLLRAQHGAHEIVVRGPEGIPAIPILLSYFAGDLAALARIEVATKGTNFEEKVWSALGRIPAGSFTTYGRLARELGHADPRMAKEVGAAVGANPVQIVVGCHRVIGANGDLKGYAGGKHRKEWLLRHEQVELPAQQATPRSVRAGDVPIQQQALEFLAAE